VIGPSLPARENRIFFLIFLFFKSYCEEITQFADVDLFLLFRDMTCHDLIAPIKILTECSGERENKKIVSSSVLLVFL
jgi:hypothetical protein